MPLDSAQLSTYAIASASALAGGLIGTLFIRTLALKLNIVNKPNPLIPQHTRPIAYLGGLGVALGLTSGLIALYLMDVALPGLAILLPASLFLIVGIADDLLAFKPLPKFALQAIVAAVAVALGTKATITGLAALDAALSWFWITTLVNAFNFTDVCDGLLGSISAVSFIALALLDPPSAPLALTASAACLGFLFFNRPPATIFLGDAGSHLLGFLAAAITLAFVARGGSSSGGVAASAATSPLLLIASAILVVAVPLFELSFLTIVRMKKGLPWWKGSPDHFSLRLQAAGFTRTQTDLLAATFAAAWAAAGLALVNASPIIITLVALATLTSIALASTYLLRHEVKPRLSPPSRSGGGGESSKPEGVPPNSPLHASHPSLSPLGASATP